MPPNAFKSAPLVVLNGFGGQEHLKLVTVSEMVAKSV
jgi:hypothetical protein